MLPKNNRLSTTYEFAKTKKFGDKFFSENFYLYILPVENSPLRVGVVVSKHFSKIAVERNKAKRLINECFRQNLANLKDNFWIVVYPKKEILGKKYEEISLDFNKFLSDLPISR